MFTQMRIGRRVSFDAASASPHVPCQVRRQGFVQSASVGGGKTSAVVPGTFGGLVFGGPPGRLPPDGGGGGFVSWAPARDAARRIARAVAVRDIGRPPGK